MGEVNTSSPSNACASAAGLPQVVAAATIASRLSSGDSTAASGLSMTTSTSWLRGVISPLAGSTILPGRAFAADLLEAEEGESGVVATATAQVASELLACSTAAVMATSTLGAVQAWGLRCMLLTLESGALAGAGAGVAFGSGRGTLRGMHA